MDPYVARRAKRKCESHGATSEENAQNSRILDRSLSEIGSSSSSDQGADTLEDTWNHKSLLGESRKRKRSYTTHTSESTKIKAETTQRDQIEHSEKPKHSENPFSQFRHQPTTQPIQARRPASSWKSFRPNNLMQSTQLPKAKRQLKSSELVPVRSLCVDEQEKITRKWHSMADPTAPLEVRRFQVMISARLHARCQEMSVRKAMANLRVALPEVNPTTLSQADPEELSQHIGNLQFYKTKAQQIVKAAKEIANDFGGIVPEEEGALLRITGLGPVFADLLSFVNTRASHVENSKKIPIESETRRGDNDVSP